MRKNNFQENLQKIIEYHNENNRHPSTKTYLGKWLSNQSHYYHSGKMPMNHAVMFKGFLDEHPVIKGYTKKKNGTYVVEKFCCGRVLRMTCFSEQKAKEIYEEISVLSSGKKDNEIDEVFSHFTSTHPNCRYTVRKSYQKKL